jgi:hypothetical protein
VRTFLTEARRIEAACDRGELVPAMLGHALAWWLYTNRTRRGRRGDKVWQPRAFLGGAYGAMQARRVAFSAPAVVASGSAQQEEGP